MKYKYLIALFLVFVFHTSCGQNQTLIGIGQVRNIKQDRNGNILIAAGFGGVLRYDGKSFTNLTSNPGSQRFWDVLEDRHGNLWFTSVDSGLYYYPSASLRAGGKSFQHFTTREGLPNNSVMCIYEDRAGMIWLGTIGSGLIRYDPSASLRAGSKSFQNFSTKEGLPHNITTIMEDKTGKLWIGTRDEAFVYDGKTFTTLTHEGKAFYNVWSIIEDKKGNIWFGENGGRASGLWRYDPSASLRASGSVFTKVSERIVYAVIEDKKGNIWTTGVNPGEGVWALSRYDQKSLYNKTPTVTDIKSGEFMSFLALFEAKDGSIWFGSAGGVYRYDGRTITDFKSKEGQK